MHRLFLIYLALTLTACQVAGQVEHRLSAELPAANSRLVLKQELVIPAGSAHATLQGGRVVDGKQFDHYRPYCELEVQKVREKPQTLHPDEFVVRRAYHETQPYSRAAGFLRVANGPDHGGPSHFVFRTILDLTAPRQPEVRWMICQQWGDPALGTYPTLEEIRNALGNYFTLLPPASGG